MISSITVRGKNIESQFEYSNHTLKNKFGIRDPKKLGKKEYNITSHEMSAILKRGYKIKNIDQLKDIHKAMFGRIYNWAGKVRNYDMTKNGHTFFPYSQMNMASVYTNGLISNIQHKKNPSSKDYAKLLDTVNEMHPFREGNGRSSKCFLQAIAINHHQFLQYDRNESEAVKGLDNGNVNLVAKHMHIEKLKSPSDLNMKIFNNKKMEQNLANHKFNISGANPDKKGQKLMSKHINHQSKIASNKLRKNQYSTSHCSHINAMHNSRSSIQR